MNDAGWLPGWLLKFVAGAFLVSSMAWAKSIDDKIEQGRIKAETYAADSASLRAYAEETQRSLDRIERRIESIQTKLNK